MSWLLRIGVALAILAYIFHLIPFSDVLGALLSAHGVWIAIAFVLLVFERFAAALRISILTTRLGMSLSVLRIWEINTVSLFYSTFAPGEIAGGVVRWYRMSKPSGHRAQAFAAIAFERLIDTITLLAFGLLFWFWDRPPYGTTSLNFALVAILGALIAAMSLSLSTRTSQLLYKIAPWLPGAYIRQFFCEKTEKVLVSVRAFRGLSAGKYFWLIGLTIIRHLLSILILLCFALALDMSIGLAALGWIRSLLNIITMMPITFSGLGVREGSLIVLLAPYGVPGSQAVAFSLLTFVVHLILGAAGGLLEVKNVLWPSKASTVSASHASSRLKARIGASRETL